MPPGPSTEAAARLIALLRLRGLTLATCESLTAGLVGATLTAVPGSSAAYRGGLVTYASDLKVSWAGVDADLVAREGVINEATAEQMAYGVRASAGADIGISCTGVAGPDGQDGAPPGRVWLCAADADASRTRRLDLAGDREQVRRQTVVELLALLEEFLTDRE